MTVGSPLVCFEGVARSYGAGRAAVVAVHDASLSVFPGEAIALVGPSGSGKTTLLHLLAGLDEPTRGSVAWPGLGGHPRDRRSGLVSMIFQGPSLVESLTSEENVELPLLLSGESSVDARSRAKAALDSIGLRSIATSLPEELSGGQAQRVAVARALVALPSLLLADEPTGQLDSATAADVIAAILHAASASGAALIVSTHDARIADRLPIRWTMTDGRLTGT